MGADYVLGVDGGGTKTLALVANGAGEIIGRGVGGICNYRAVGADAALASLQEAVTHALKKAHVEIPQVRAACFGLAGVDRPSEHAHLNQVLSTLLPNTRIKIVNDAELILAAGTPAGWGIGVISGTGSIIFGKSSDGRIARGGGWGYILGDEGSGYGIGLKAVRAVARAADKRGPQTALTANVLAHWELHVPQDLIEEIYTMPHPRVEIAKLASVVDETAQAGDAVAQEIMRDAAQELALGARVVADALEFTEVTPCALTGGVFLKSVLLEKLFRAAAEEKGLNLSPIQKVDEPARGAIVLARSLN